jgi:hypothetical protein
MDSQKESQKEGQKESQKEGQKDNQKNNQKDDQKETTESIVFQNIHDQFTQFLNDKILQPIQYWLEHEKNTIVTMDELRNSLRLRVPKKTKKNQTQSDLNDQKVVKRCIHEFSRGKTPEEGGRRGLKCNEPCVNNEDYCPEHLEHINKKMQKKATIQPNTTVQNNTEQVGKTFGFISTPIQGKRVPKVQLSKVPGQDPNIDKKDVVYVARPFNFLVKPVEFDSNNVPTKIIAFSKVVCGTNEPLSEEDKTNARRNGIYVLDQNIHPIDKNKQTEAKNNTLEKSVNVEPVEQKSVKTVEQKSLESVEPIKQVEQKSLESVEPIKQVEQKSLESVEPIKQVEQKSLESVEPIKQVEQKSLESVEPIKQVEQKSGEIKQSDTIKEESIESILQNDPLKNIVFNTSLLEKKQSKTDQDQIMKSTTTKKNKKSKDKPSNENVNDNVKDDKPSNENVNNNVKDDKPSNENLKDDVKEDKPLNDNVKEDKPLNDNVKEDKPLNDNVKESQEIKLDSKKTRNQ